VLPARARLRSRSEFTAVIRRGRRAVRGGLVAHALTSASGGQPDATDQTAGSAGAPGPRVGFAVGRNVGGAVQRNRLRRRLRHLARAELGGLPPGTAVVIRALPSAAQRSPSELGSDLRAALAAIRRAPIERARPGAEPSR
jgi:ribonuclease P protein component